MLGSLVLVFRGLTLAAIVIGVDADQVPSWRFI